MDINKSDKEINLFDFILMGWNAFKRLCLNILNLILRIIRLSIQYFWLTIICVILGIFAGYLWTKPYFTVYHAEANISFSEGMKPYITDGLNLFVSTDHGVLKERYDVPLAGLKNMKKYQVLNIIDAKNDSIPDFVDYSRKIKADDSINVVMPTKLHLYITAKNFYEFDKFQGAMKRFLYDQASIAEADRISKYIEREKLKRYDKEISRLDSLINFEYFERPRAVMAMDGNIFSLSNNTTLYHEQLLSLIKHRNYLRAHINNNPDIINFDSNFIIYSKRIIEKYAIGLAVGYLLSVILALLIKYRKIVFSFLKEK